MTAAVRHPLASTYDPDWLSSLDMGPNPLWQLETLVDGMDLRSGTRILDLGCGKGATSVFLARELRAHVTACDLWVTEDDLSANLEEAGVADRVQAVNADARNLPFGEEEFDAVVSIDAFEYFGTDARFLPSLLRHVRPGGTVGMTTPGLRVDPYAEDPPAYVSEVLGWEVAAWHSPLWWARHWTLSGMVGDVHASMQPHSREDWLAWCELTGEAPTDPVPAMLAADTEELVGFVQAWAHKL